MPRRKQSKGRLGGGDDGDPGYHSEYEGGGGGRYGVGREGDGDDTDHEDGGRGHGVDFGTETVRYAIPLEMQAIDIVDIGNVFATGNDIQTKLSQAQIDQIGDMLHGPNLGITKGTLVPYDPDATMRSLLQVPSVCIFKDENDQLIGVYLLLKVRMRAQTINGESKMMMQALMVQAGKLTGYQPETCQPERQLCVSNGTWVTLYRIPSKSCAGENFAKGVFGLFLPWLTKKHIWMI